MEVQLDLGGQWTLEVEHLASLMDVKGHLYVWSTSSSDSNWAGVKGKTPEDGGL